MYNIAMNLQHKVSVGHSKYIQNWQIKKKSANKL